MEHNLSNKFETVIGLEIHLQLDTETKLFCPCAIEENAPANKNICPICTGQPGVLPALNKKAVELAVKAALSLNCKINKRSVFARKNYFYPDCPKNYQISQHKIPLAETGYLVVFTAVERLLLAFIE